MIWAPLERGDSGLSKGAHIIKILYDLRKLRVIEDWTIRRPTAFLNFSTLLESGITFNQHLRPYYDPY